MTPEEKLANLEAEALSLEGDALTENDGIDPSTLPNVELSEEQKKEEPDKCSCGNDTFKVYDTYTSCLKCGKNVPLLN